MSNKHFLPKDPAKLVPNCLEAITYEYPFLSVLSKEKVVFNNNHVRSKVTLISGGGLGHEPGFYGLVGTGMLSAVAHGDVFASPNYRNVKAAEKVCHELDGGDLEAPWAGCIFILTNYTGDNLYFGMAAQDLISRYGSEKIRVLRVTDDVSVTRSAGLLVGRRTLAGIAVVSKLTGAAAEAGHDIESIYQFGQAVIDLTASINAGLDHVHISGHSMDSDFGKLKPNELEIGLGIHNEPGVQKLDYIPRNEELIAKLLKMVLDTSDQDRGFFQYKKGDKIALFINNLGGVPIIEEKNILYTTLSQLKEDYSIEPVRVYTGNFVTSFNAQIFTITLFNASTAASETFGIETIFEYLDQRTDAVCWPNTEFHNKLEPIDTSKQIIHDFVGYSDDAATEAIESGAFMMAPQKLERIVRAAAERVIQKEPELTDWDTRMGDGDCGHGLKSGAELVLQKLDQGIAEKGLILTVLHEVLNIIKDDMGGTLGAIIFIFMKLVINHIEELIRQHHQIDTQEAFAKALDAGLTNLFDYTKAREGHRTVMDVLIPFVRSFSQDQDIHKAVKVAYEAAEGTRKLKPKLGRATYVGGLDDKRDLPPDPGAYGIYEIISALEVE